MGCRWGAENERARPPGAAPMEALSLGDAVELSATLRRAADGATSMEQAAQNVVRALDETLVHPDGGPACVLVRLFKTHPWEALPTPLQEDAAALSSQDGTVSPPGMACLTLLATTGVEPAWRDRVRSRHHRVIPLPSRQAVERAPMVSSLLTDLGVDLDAVLEGRPPAARPAASRRLDVFHVPQAVGSPRVPAQESFVVPYGVRSVLGFGGLLPDGQVFAVLLFSRARITPEAAALFRPVAHAVHLALLPFLGGAVFDTDPAGTLGDSARATETQVLALEELLCSHEETTREQTTRLVEEQAALRSALAELGRSERRYESLVRVAAQIVWRADTEGLVEDIPEWRAITGQTPEQVHGTGWLAAVHPEDRARVDGGWRAAVATADRYEAEFRLRHADGSYRTVISRGTPLVDRGRISEWIGMCTDVSELRREEAGRRAAYERLAMLANAGQLLAQDLDVDVTLANLSRLLVPTLADWCCVHLREDTGAIRLVATQHSDPGLHDALTELLSAFTVTVEQPYGAGFAIATGRSQLLPEIDETVLQAVFGADPASLARVRALKITTGLIVPLITRGRTIGAISMARAGGQQLNEVERELAEDISRRAALALDNARLFQAQRAVALGLQHGLLPTLPAIPGLALGARYAADTAAAQVGGDWYDAFPLPGGATGLVIGDVMGHDLTAAAAMGQLRSALRTAAWDEPSPARVLDRLDQLVQSFGLADLATVCYGRLEPSEVDGGQARLRYANAGHLPPLLIPPEGDPVLLTGGQGVLIGAPSKDLHRDAELDVPAGATLVFYTDGLVEHREEDLGTGLERLRRAACAIPRDAHVDEVCAQLLSMVRITGNRDDVALLAVRLLPAA